MMSNSNKKRKVEENNDINMNISNSTTKPQMRAKTKIRTSLKQVIKKTAIFTSGITCTTSSFTTTTSPYFSSPSIRTINTQSCPSSDISSSTAKNSDVERTKSFEAIWSNDITIPIHTLVLGTHPSIQSLSKQQYFGHPMNAFWWIAGDCLEFRRDDGVSESTLKPFKFTEHLRFDAAYVMPYEAQMDVFTSKGFALWDIVQSCEREGSLDSNIRMEVPNDIRAFCEVHGRTIRRIVIANGQGGSRLFLKHFRSWWEDDDDEALSLMPGQNEESLRAFSKYKDRTKANIELISALAVSPAAATFTYLEKRAFWEKYCYKPGLEDYNGFKRTKDLGH